MDSLKLQGVISMMNRVPALRKLIHRGPYVALCSMGGVGSTALARHIGSIADKTVREHAYSPSVYDNESSIRLGYVFGNPYNSVLSVFRRDFQDMHVKAMNANSGTVPASLKDITIEEYLARGVDEFYLDRQLSNWMNPDRVKHPTILIKYEDLADNIDAVLDFFGCEKPFEVKTRRSDWEEQPEAVRAGLKHIYGDFQAKVDVMPAITILQPRAALKQKINA